MDLPKPFRWNTQKWAQLGRLLVDTEGEGRRQASLMLGYLDAVRACSAQVMSHCRDASLLFVGRSPESLFDYLSGALEGTEWADRVTFLPLSIRGRTTAQIRADFPPSTLTGMRQVLTDVGLSPQGIIGGQTRYALVDVIDTGDTMESLCDFLCTWAREEALDLSAMRRNLSIVGLTIRTENSPSTWRWQQNVDWLDEYPSDFVKNVSVDWAFWDTFGNWRVKPTQSHHPGRWRTDGGAKPPREENQRLGLYVAWRLYQTGRTFEERRALGRAMAAEVGMKHDWYRRIAKQLTR